MRYLISFIFALAITLALPTLYAAETTDTVGGVDQPFGGPMDIVDGDSVHASEDNCPTVANQEQEDGDKDLVGDACDNCTDDYNPDQANWNGSDTPGDACEDFDKDTIFDSDDNCPIHWNEFQEDRNNNDVGDACEDFDHDGTLDNVDKCPDDANPGQEDWDDNGVGDACDCSTPILVLTILTDPENCIMGSGDNSNLVISGHFNIDWETTGAESIEEDCHGYLKQNLNPTGDSGVIEFDYDAPLAAKEDPNDPSNFSPFALLRIFLSPIPDAVAIWTYRDEIDIPYMIAGTRSCIVTAKAIGTQARRCDKIAWYQYTYQCPQP